MTDPADPADPAAADPAFERARSAFLDGLAHLEAGRAGAAADAFEASLRAMPGRTSTLVNLAAARLRLGQADAALAAADRALAAAPADAEAWFHRGEALALLHRPAEALTAFERAAAGATRAEPWVRHGQTLQALDRHDAAAGSYERALAIDPTLATVWSHLGGIRREAMRLAEAEHAYRQALAHGADPALTNYCLAAVTAHGAALAPAALGPTTPARSVAPARPAPPTPPIAPAGYVESLFDDYAPSFDAHLVGTLGYRAHTDLAARAERLAGGRLASAIDLGCGTGLLGPALDAWVDHLTGIDLSRRMLEAARTLGVYDRLRQGDAVEALRDTEAGSCDLVIAADVFIYIGDLAPVHREAHRVLGPGGMFCYTAEPLPADADAPPSTGYALLPSLRYAHTDDYLRATAQAAGFTVVELERAPIRSEQGRAVDGLYVGLRRN